MATAEQTVHVSEFTNEPFIDFSKPENRARMEDALKKVKAEFGREYPMWLNGQKVVTADKRTSTNPSRPSEVIGVFQNAHGGDGAASGRRRAQIFRHLEESACRRSARSFFFAPRKSFASGNLS